MTVMMETRRGPGRPRIGVHMQTRVPDDYAAWIEEESQRRGMEYPEFLREVIAAGVWALQGEE